MYQEEIGPWAIYFMDTIDMLNATIWKDETEMENHDIHFDILFIVKLTFLC